jgi:hypothetical protein
MLNVETNLNRWKGMLYWAVTVLFLLPWAGLILTVCKHWTGASPDTRYVAVLLAVVYPSPWILMSSDRCQTKLLVMGCCSYLALMFSVSAMFH